MYATWFEVIKKNTKSSYDKLRRFNIISRNLAYVYSFNIIIVTFSLISRFSQRRFVLIYMINYIYKIIII